MYNGRSFKKKRLGLSTARRKKIRHRKVTVCKTNHLFVKTNNTILLLKEILDEQKH